MRMGIPKRTKQSLTVCTGKSEAEVINNKRLCLSYCTAKANYRQTRSIVWPSQMAEILVQLT